MRIILLCIILLLVRISGQQNAPIAETGWKFYSDRPTDSFIAALEHHPLRHYLNFSNVHHLKNKLIVFIGDSSSTFQYLSLARFFSDGTWLEDNGMPPLLPGKQSPDWSTYFYFSSLRIGCQEILDAHREGSGGGDFENRYFHHFGLNFTIFSFSYAPTNPITLGRSIPSMNDFKENCFNPSTWMESLRSAGQSATKQSFRDIEDFLRKEISPLQPDVILFSGQDKGPWDTSRMERVFESLQMASRLVPIWRIPPANRQLNPSSSSSSSSSSNVLSSADRLRSVGFKLLDLYSYSSAIMDQPAAFADDTTHLQPFCYRELNLVLLDFLKDLLLSSRPADKKGIKTKESDGPKDDDLVSILWPV